VGNIFFSYTLILGHIRISGLTVLSFLIHLILFEHEILRFSDFDALPQNNTLSQNMPSKKVTRTQLPVTDIHDSVDRLQTAASRAKHATPGYVPGAEIDNVDDDYPMWPLELKETKITRSTTILVFPVPTLLTKIV
jgi:hypothetical protein